MDRCKRILLKINAYSRYARLAAKGIQVMRRTSSQLDDSLSWPDGKMYFSKYSSLPYFVTVMILQWYFTHCWRGRDNAIDPEYPKQIRDGFAGTYP